MTTTGNARFGWTVGAMTALAAMIGGTALAADLPVYVYDEPIYDKSGAWYLRGDIGYVATTNHKVVVHASHFMMFGVNVPRNIRMSSTQSFYNLLE